MKRTSFSIMLDSYLKIGMKIDNNFDAVRREIKYKGKTGILYFLSTLTSSVQIMGIIESLVNIDISKCVSKEIYVGPISYEDNYQNILKLCLSGVACLILENCDKAIMIETREYPTRSISEPTTEKTIRGSKDGFNESINTNIGLIRRRIRDKNLTIDLFSIGKKSKTDVALIYLDDCVDSKIKNEIKQKLNNINVDSLVMSDRALEEILFNQNKSLFPLVRYTERPDVASIELYQGKMLIMVDTSASVIITPTTIFDHVHHVEEYRESPFAGTFLRLIRNLAIILSIFLIPLWLALVTETDINNYFILKPSKETSIPIIVQILLAELFMEMIRIAIVHTPSELTSAISMVSAIILGSVSIELEIFLPEILVYVSFETIASFATPSYELSNANKLTKYYLLLLTALFGRVGFLFGTTSFICYLSGINTLGMPYLYPIVPFDIRKVSNLFFRKKGNKTL